MTLIGRCSLKSCGAWVKTWGITTNISECSLTHNHEPLTTKQELKQQIAGAAKRKAIDEPGERPSKIFRGLIDPQAAEHLTVGKWYRCAPFKPYSRIDVIVNFQYFFRRPMTSVT